MTRRKNMVMWQSWENVSSTRQAPGFQEFCSVKGCSFFEYEAGLCERHCLAAQQTRERGRAIALGRWTREERKRLADNCKPYPDYIYAIRAENGMVKFGFSKDPQARYVTLDCASPVQLQLLGYVPASKRLERFLHQLLKEWNFKGEWFRPSILTDKFAEAIGNKDIDAFERLFD